MPKKPLTCCPHCGGTSGLYTKTTYINVPYFFGFRGEVQNNGEMFDLVYRFSGGRICYCQDCGKPVCRTSSLDFEPGALG